MQLLNRPTRNLFFSGKGGVGKTSTSCAVAVALADAGKSVLLVSTDPASNIDEMFGVALQNSPTAIPAVPRLKAMNVDPQAAAVAYRERVVGPYRDLLPADALASIEEQFAGACTVEIAAFDEFAKLLANADLTKPYDHIIFDTAPTGHTLRLLALPTAWAGFLGASTAGTSCVGPLQGMAAQRVLYESAMTTLADRRQTTMVLVSRPEKPALDEAARTCAELQQIGMTNQVLVLNGVFDQPAVHDRVAVAMARIGTEAIRAMPAVLASLPRTAVSLKPRQVIGADALRIFFEPASGATASASAAAASAQPLPGLDVLIEQLYRAGPGVVMTMGKGGVGKTTIAARIAIALAERGCKVHLTTTDPAAHVRAAVGELPGTLTVGEIDPRVEVARYRSEVLATTGAKLDADGRALLEEDLNSPCTEEIAVFQAFARNVAAAVDRVVVVDTAPTGHTILLLDATQAYHRELTRQSSAVTDAVKNLLPRLRDPSFTRILLCTLAEATPVHEAAALQADLRRAGIEPQAWIINQSLTPLSVSDPLLLARRAQEHRYIDEVVNTHARNAFLAPWREQGVAESKSPSSARAALV